MTLICEIKSQISIVVAPLRLLGLENEITTVSIIIFSHSLISASHFLSHLTVKSCCSFQCRGVGDEQECVSKIRCKLKLGSEEAAVSLETESRSCVTACGDFNT